jgi:hypothetical protein
MAVMVAVWMKAMAAPMATVAMLLAVMVMCRRRRRRRRGRWSGR